MHRAPERLVLGSGSRYRRELLSRLGIAFDVHAPEVDETPRAGEAVATMVERLTRAKAAAVVAAHPDAVVIASDQAGEFDGRPLGKPGTREAAIAQLTAMSGAEVAFHTGLCVAAPGKALQWHLDRTAVRLRSLSTDEITRYVDAEQPLDCAGSFKSEGRGIALFDAVRSEDPTALVGLPLIATARMLRVAGFALP